MGEKLKPGFKLFQPLKRMEPPSGAGGIVTWDTEDNGEGDLELAVVYFGPPGSPDDERRRVFKTKAELISFFMSREARSRTFWAHNLEYDINSLFGQIWRIPGEWRLVRSTYGGRMMGAILQRAAKSLQGKKAKRKWSPWCRFNNSLNIFQSSVAEMGKELGLEKGDRLAAEAGSESDRIFYCERDCEIIWRKMAHFNGTVHSFGAKLKTTIASTAMDVYRRNFQDATWLRRSKAMDVFERLGYYGARTECFEVGDIDGPLSEFDVNSMYPWAATKELPHPGQMKFAEPFRFDLAKEGCAEVTIDVPESYLPPLPVRWDSKIMFPWGKLSGVWTHFELREAVDRGAKILEVRSALQTDTKWTYMKKYVDALWALRKESKGSDRAVYKALLNHLYGKFGQSPEIEEYWWDDDEGDKRKKHGKHLKSEVRLSPEILRVRLSGRIPLHCAVIWASYITARARVKLLGLLEKSKRPIYCDTDSVWAPPGNLPTGDELGDLKLEKTFSRVRVTAPKLYCCWGDDGKMVKCAAKGIPRRVQRAYFERQGKGIAFQAPVRWLESFKTGSKINKWIWKYRALTADYDKRRVLPGGKTVPWKMSDLATGKTERVKIISEKREKKIAFELNLARRVRLGGGLADNGGRDIPSWVMRKRGLSPAQAAEALGFPDSESFLDALASDIVRFYT